MTRLDTPSDESLAHSIDQNAPCMLLLESREVPLGGIRGITVHRSLPQRALPMVGAWCFLDRFDENGVAMRVLPHPHIGLQTVTWPLEGAIRHRDSVGSDVGIEPGQLNIMTSGHGISHSEFSLPDGEDAPTGDMRGAQLWIALPAEAASAAPRFEQHAELPVWHGDGVDATVLVGALGAGESRAASPATIHSPLVGADAVIAPGADAQIPLDPAFEHAVLVFDGRITVDGTELASGPLLYLGLGRDQLRVSSTDGGRFLLIGGAPFAEDLIMWWNFVARTQTEIESARDDWERDADRFGNVDGHGGERIPAPPLPGVRLLPRKRLV